MNRCVLYRHRTRAEWLDLRSQCVTSTDAAAVMGRDKYRSTGQALYDKIHGAPKVDNEHTRRGIRMEPCIVRHWAETTGNRARSFGLFARSVQYPHLGCTPDAVARDRSGTLLLEIKCPADLAKFRADRRRKEMYVWQLRHQLLATGIRRGLVVAADEGLTDMYTIEAKIDETWVDDYLYRSQVFIAGVESGCLPMEMW